MACIRVFATAVLFSAFWTPAHALPTEIEHAYEVCSDPSGSAHDQLKACSKLILYIKTNSLFSTEIKLRDIYVSRAMVYKRLGETAEALEDIDHATDLILRDPVSELMSNGRFGRQPHSIYLLRGQMEIEAGKYQEALGSLVEAVHRAEASTTHFSSESEKIKDISAIVGSIGVAQASLGNVDEALAALNLAIEQDANNAKAYVARAAVHKSLGHADLSAADMARAQALGAQVDFR
jgi:tetratricopeptide (TPR) repeat protein